MSVQLQRFSETGTLCPKCGNKSVFTDDIKSWWGTYRYTQIMCHIPCGYKILTDKNSKIMKRVYAVQDDSSHWYVIPVELKDSFYADCENEEMTDSGEFDEKYGRYMTGGDLNLVELYANV